MVGSSSNIHNSGRPKAAGGGGGGSGSGMGAAVTQKLGKFKRSVSASVLRQNK